MKTAYFFLIFLIFGYSQATAQANAIKDNFPIYSNIEGVEFTAEEYEKFKRQFDSDIEISIELTANNGILNIGVTVENNGTGRIMLDRKRFLPPWHFVFQNEYGQLGEAAGGRIRNIELDFRINADDIVIIEPGTIWRSDVPQRYGKTQTHVTFFGIERDARFPLSGQVFIKVYYSVHESERQRMLDLGGDATLLPGFTRIYELHGIL